MSQHSSRRAGLPSNPQRVFPTVAGGSEGAPFITVSGADEKTDVSILAGFDAEVGLLYRAGDSGGNRHPRKGWMAEAARNLRRVAVHICGSHARTELLAHQLDELLANAQRIQVNGGMSAQDLGKICKHFPQHQIITQHHSKNQHLLAVEAANHSVLVDESGGRGISPDQWTAPPTLKRVGYAGGLGPDNIAIEKRRIAANARGEWWLDMEGKLRVDDWFSCELAARAVSAFHSGSPAATDDPQAHAKQRD